jgi:hypothetical protein
MAKNSRGFIAAAGAALLLASALDGAALAAGLPLRAGPAAPDRVLSGLAEGLTFKLPRLAQSSSGWAAMVEETVLVARRLGTSDVGVAAQRTGELYAVVVDNDTIIVGADADVVLGRLLYVLAHTPSPDVAPSAAALAVLDQPLSATLAALSSISSP